jgi:hypothetical protein
MNDTDTVSDGRWEMGGIGGKGIGGMTVSRG